MSEFGWQQKAAALEALSEISIRCRGLADWYVHQCVEVKDGCVLVGLYGNGCSPIEAIENHWKVLVDDLPRDKYLVVRAMRGDRKAVRWNGFMWQEVREPRIESQSKTFPRSDDED